MLVSLFFVVAAMLEFALVLLVQRKLDAANNIFANEHMRSPVTRGKQKISNVSTFDDTRKFKTGGLQEFRKDNNPQNKQMTQVSRSNGLRLTTDNIDMMACILFIALYILYNLFYWM